MNTLKSDYAKTDGACADLYRYYRPKLREQWRWSPEKEFITDIPGLYIELMNNIMWNELAGCYGPAGTTDVYVRSDRANASLHNLSAFCQLMTHRN